jgi:hypothetical protein
MWRSCVLRNARQHLAVLRANIQEAIPGMAEATADVRLVRENHYTREYPNTILRAMRRPDRRLTSHLPGSPAGSLPEDGRPSKPGASGAVNRLLGPDSVRHMSVTTATEGLTAEHHETRRHSSKKARETGKTQLTGRLRRWWQVLGSNQRRLSRRFYRPLVSTHRNGR